MRHSNAFLALIVLIAAPILFLFGVSAFPAKEASNAAAQDDAAYVVPLERPTVAFGNPVRGAIDAKVTIVEFGDFHCAPCADFESSVAATLAARPNEVRFVWKDFPNETAHVGATDAAIAARCADEQGAFWEYHDALLGEAAGVTTSSLTPLAEALGLDAATFQACLDGKRTAALVARDVEEGLRLRIDATPTIFIGDRRVAGSLTADQLDAIVAAEIAKKEAEKKPAN